MTSDQLVEIAAALRCKDGFDDMLGEISRLQAVATRAQDLAAITRHLLEYCRFSEGGKVKCSMCKQQYYGPHTGSCPVGKLKTQLEKK